MENGQDFHDWEVSVACFSEKLRISPQVVQDESKSHARAPSRIGIFVERIATSILMISGMVPSRVNSPARMSAPHSVSTTPTNGAITSAHGIPILAKTPCSHLTRKEKLLNAFGEKEAADQQANGNHRCWTTRRSDLLIEGHAKTPFRSTSGSVCYALY